MSPKLVVRPCTQQDMPAVCEIYALEVREGTASFELEPPSIAEMAGRFAAIEAAGLPYLVVELEGRIAGYAYAGPYRRARPIGTRWKIRCTWRAGRGAGASGALCSSR